VALDYDSGARVTRHVFAALLIAWGGLALLHEYVIKVQHQLSSRAALVNAAKELQAQVIWNALSILMETLALVAVAAGCILLAGHTDGWVGIGWCVVLMLIDCVR